MGHLMTNSVWGGATNRAWGRRETSSKKRGMKKGTRNSQGLTSSWSFLKYLLSVLSIPSPPTNPRWDLGPSFTRELAGAPGIFNADKQPVGPQLMFSCPVIRAPTLGVEHVKGSHAGSKSQALLQLPKVLSCVLSHLWGQGSGHSSEGDQSQLDVHRRMCYLGRLINGLTSPSSLSAVWSEWERTPF